MGLTDLESKMLKAAAVTRGNTEPLAVRLDEAQRISGMSRSELYRRNASGDIIFLKCNSRVLVDYASLKRNLAAMPRTKVKPV